MRHARGMTKATLSIGVAGLLGPEAIARIAVAVEDAGFHALWVNDTPGGDALGGLAAAALVTDRLVLATGVVPVDRQPAALIAALSAELPQDRLVLGIGSGGLRRGILPVMRGAISDLRRDTGARVMLGALGPRMRELAATDADGPLLSWLTPAAAHEQATEARATRSAAHVALYVRAALESAAGPRLAEEAARYASFPTYAANFRRLGIAADETVLTPATAVPRLDDYRDAVDEVVLRAITAGNAVEDYLRFVARAATLV
jgi:alkanesulfonate monooxygenase SsuD/methylene tetrahydromethanopterin reductase-like flavin-dependent oxidoreductase (luciferase family)